MGNLEIYTKANLYINCTWISQDYKKWRIMRNFVLKNLIFGYGNLYCLICSYFGLVNTKLYSKCHLCINCIWNLWKSTTPLQKMKDSEKINYKSTEIWNLDKKSSTFIICIQFQEHYFTCHNLFLSMYFLQIDLEFSKKKIVRILRKVLPFL